MAAPSKFGRHRKGRKRGGRTRKEEREKLATGKRRARINNNKKGGLQYNNILEDKRE